MDAVIFGNVTLDIICYPVNNVPRRESISFDQVAVSPGGCASNVAIGMATIGIPTALVARTGDDDSAELLYQYWRRVGLDTRFVERQPDIPTAVSVGLVDSNFQPRFVHTPGANGALSAEALDIPSLAAAGARFLHVAGFFVLPGLLDERLSQKLAQAQNLGLRTSLDVVFTERMDDPHLRASLWAAMPHLDHFLCNDYEAYRMTDIRDSKKAARALKARGATNVIVKLGEKGCWVESDSFTGRIPAPKAEVVDTTGAGDAFAAGFIAALCRGADLPTAAEAGNRAGARIVGRLGAIQAWLDYQRNR
ncbi:MAG: carbohydrate kinase family protein [Chloroflexi bacterium]|nr:carbohydrate kinase family protein [Chloroflexota bacterium]